jgi:hypothetical protein
MVIEGTAVRRCVATGVVINNRIAFLTGAIDAFNVSLRSKPTRADMSAAIRHTITTHSIIRWIRTFAQCTASDIGRIVFVHSCIGTD